MTQELLLQLGNAFSIDTLVQVPVTVTNGSTDATTAPRLAGKIEIIDPGTGEEISTPSAFSFSTAKVSMVEPGATANFMLSVKSPAENKSAKLTLNYVITDMEMPTATTGIGDYQGSSWLKFVIPVSTPQTSIGPVNIPIPLRFYPSPVTLLSQSAEQSYPTPASDSNAVELLAWDYNFVYTHDNAEQDTPTVIVQFDTAASANASNSSFGSTQLQNIFAALAQFIAVYPVLQDDLALLRTGATNNVASNAVQAFHDIVKGAAKAFGGQVLGQGLPFVPQPSIYGYMAQQQYTNDNAGLLSLTLTSVNTDGEVAPNTTILWPTLYIIPPGATTEIAIQPQTTTDTSAVYPYPLLQQQPPKPIPAGSQFPQRFQLQMFPGPNNTPTAPQGIVAPQTYTFNQANAFLHQSGYAGVSIARNLILVYTPDTNQPIPTNPAFIYETPLTNFQSLAVPFIFANNEIPLPAATTVGQSLGTFLQALLTTQNTTKNTWIGQYTQVEMRIAAAYSYVVASTQGDNVASTELGGLVPILLIPNVQFDATADWDWTQSGSVVSQIDSAINTWYKANTPVATTGSSYVFDVTIFAAGGNLQPLIRASTMRYMIPPGTSGS
jgi:hypothetical protein